MTTARINKRVYTDAPCHWTGDAVVVTEYDGAYSVTHRTSGIAFVKCDDVDHAIRVAKLIDVDVVAWDVQGAAIKKRAEGVV